MKHAAALGFAGVAFLAFAGPALADQYKYAKITVPGGVETRALYVNEAHQVAGSYTLPDGQVRLFTYDQGQIRTFKAPASHAGKDIRPTAIGPTGLVVGVYGNKNKFPFLLKPGADEVETLPYPSDGQEDVTPTAISPDDAETVAGYETVEGTLYGFITYPKTNPGNWGEYTFGGATSFTITALANIPNTNDGYAGTYVFKGRQHGYQGDSSAPIDPEGSRKTWLTYLNNDGDLGGHAVDKAGDTFGFVRRGRKFKTYRFPESSHTTVTRSLGSRVFGEFKREKTLRGFLFQKGKYFEVRPGAQEVTLTGVAADGAFSGSFVDRDGVRRGYLATCEAASGVCSLGGPGVAPEAAETAAAD